MSIPNLKSAALIVFEQRPKSIGVTSPRKHSLCKNCFRGRVRTVYTWEHAFQI